LSKYVNTSEKLISEGQAYRCFCTPEELDALKAYNMQNAEDGHSGYNGKCRHIHADESAQRAHDGEKHCVRFKTPAGAKPSFHDLVYGKYKKLEAEDDFILMKRDGYPTYHFANVVDDHLMEVTHVVRGAVREVVRR
jgi:glutamyl-tRNA synthetase